MRCSAVLLVLLLPVAGDLAHAQSDASSEPDPQSPGSPRSVALDRLLRVPGTLDLAPAWRGQRDEAAWRESFRAARAEVTKLEQSIENSQSELRKVAPANWGFTAPGGGQQSDPDVLRLRAMLRRDRQSLEASRERLRDLDVEASLAGVPDAWRNPKSASERD